MPCHFSQGCMARMNTLFVNTNLHGHINPTLGRVQELAERGNTVRYFCSEAFSRQVTDAGAEWIGFSEGLKQFLKGYRPTDRHPFYTLMEYMLLYDEAMLPEVLGIVGEGQYDLIVCDATFGGDIFLSRMLDIPVACSHSSFAMSRAPVPPHMLART